MLLGALIGYRCSLGRCRDLVLVGPLEVLVLTGHGCRNSTGASARSCMQGSHTAPGFPRVSDWCTQLHAEASPRRGHGGPEASLGVRLRGRVR